MFIKKIIRKIPLILLFSIFSFSCQSDCCVSFSPYDSPNSVLFPQKSEVSYKLENYDGGSFSVTYNRGDTIENISHHIEKTDYTVEIKTDIKTLIVIMNENFSEKERELLIQVNNSEGSQLDSSFYYIKQLSN